MGQRLQVPGNEILDQKVCVRCAWGFFMSLPLCPSWEGCERVGGVALQRHLPLCVHARVLRLHGLVLSLTLKLPG